MSPTTPHAALTRAFQDITRSLVEIFELFDADPDLVEATAYALGPLYRAPLDGSEPPPSPASACAMRELLDEMDFPAAEAA